MTFYFPKGQKEREQVLSMDWADVCVHSVLIMEGVSGLTVDQNPRAGPEPGLPAHYIIQNFITSYSLKSKAETLGQAEIHWTF